MVKSVEQALKTPASELMSAASSPHDEAAKPRAAGSRAHEREGGLGDVANRGAVGADHRRQPRPPWPVFASASAIMPGMMKMKTGMSFKYEAKMVPRRASRSFGAPRARWTMYWSVHQYQSPMMGAQINMPSHG